MMIRAIVGEGNAFGVSDGFSVHLNNLNASRDLHRIFNFDFVNPADLAYFISPHLYCERLSAVPKRSPRSTHLFNRFISSSSMKSHHRQVRPRKF